MLIQPKKPQLDHQAIVKILLSNPLVEDCYLLMCDDELIAYIVYAGIWNSEQLSTDLQAKLPNYLLPNHYVPVSCIPLTEIGQVDEIALKSIEIIDNYLIEYTEKELKCLPEIDQAAVLITPQTNNILPLHLSDILPQKETKEINEKTKIVENKSNQQDNFYPSKLAISHGKSLLKSVSNPKILGEVLQKQARENQQKGIIYIKSNGQEIFQSYQQLWDEAQRIHTGLKK
ncbi:hypothetical protein [Aphanothece sacrum]|uniref:Peptide synthetase n=1 Tax=Aphanothece sacrum FPU1 TaxID=1920663 RepID=A0A401IGC0_APHSA|nr:hypothetical protein [Aphanothece sacrum]GBF80261.1 peptide synthetase [Aphanothece sacrum FPU1]GBF83666.1 peptide synthetase [Aphanothece sacrum FPU3]